MARSTFHCIDAHTCGNPVRLVVSGAPELKGATMSEKRQDFLNRFDWIRKALMFEPRGHDMMSGSFLYPALDDSSDGSILFIETSGCLPMCGHGTIGTVTSAIEYGYLKPRVPGHLTLDVPAGKIEVEYQQNEKGQVTSVKIYNIASFMEQPNCKVHIPGLGDLHFDISYGGNFYAIIEPQENFPGVYEFGADNIKRWSPIVRQAINEKYSCEHPQDPTVNGVSHIQWTGRPTQNNSDACNAVFYGDRAIDRSPCGTGTSARMAQLFYKKKLNEGDEFVHESIIGSQFIGRVESITELNNQQAILPSIEGWSKVIGHNTIFVDSDDPYHLGFTV